MCVEAPVTSAGARSHRQRIEEVTKSELSQARHISPETQHLLLIWRFIPFQSAGADRKGGPASSALIGVPTLYPKGLGRASLTGLAPIFGLALF